MGTPRTTAKIAPIGHPKTRNPTNQFMPHPLQLQSEQRQPGITRERRKPNKEKATAVSTAPKPTLTIKRLAADFLTAGGGETGPSGFQWPSGNCAPHSLHETESGATRLLQFGQNHMFQRVSSGAPPACRQASLGAQG